MSSDGTETTPIVLYVDDEPINLRVFEANFGQDFKTVTCLSGQEALDLIHAGTHEVAVVVADQRMPKMTGVQLFEKVRDLLPDAQRLMITAYSDVTVMMDAVNRGQVARYVLKPWVRDELRLVLQDALRLYNLQSRLRHLQARMVQSAHLIAIGQVSAGIAHELMNPVTYVSQNLTSLRRDLTEVTAHIAPYLAEVPNPRVSQTLEDLPHLLEDLEAGVKHIRQVALSIRSQARGVDVDESSDLKEVALFAGKLARPEMKERARLKLSGPEVRVKMGPVALCQVLLNLIINAVQALNPAAVGGLIEVTWTETATGASCRVMDNGSGISPENLPKVFEPLFTTKPAGVGTGLGLAICRELMREAGGEIRIESQLGVGTTVELLLLRPAPGS